MSGLANRRLALSAVALLLIVGGGAIVRLVSIERTLPYPRHRDETFVIDPALAIVQTGDANPRQFMRPSLSIYLAAVGVSTGYWIERLSGEIESVTDIGPLGFPYYLRPEVARPARVLFALFSLIGIAGTSVLAASISRFRSPVVFAALFVSLSPVYLFQSWAYLNPDVIACPLAVSCLALLVRGPRTSWSAVASGLLAGFAIGAKYNYATLLVPCLLAVWVHDEPGRSGRTVGVLVGAALGFLVTTPFAVLDVANFLEGLRLQAAAYSRIDRPNSIPFFTDRLRSSFSAITGEIGIPGQALALLGLFAVARSDPRCALLVVSFPACLILHMALFPIFFPRNLVPVFCVNAVLAAIGIATVADRTRSRTRLFGTGVSAARAAGACFLMLFAILLAGLPWNRISRAYDLSWDSRIAAVRWLRTNVPPGATVVVADEIGMDARALEADYRIVRAPVASLRRTALDPLGRAWLALPGVSDAHREIGGRVAFRAGRNTIRPDRKRPGLTPDPVIELRIRDAGAHTSRPIARMSARAFDFRTTPARIR